MCDRQRYWTKWFSCLAILMISQLVISIRANEKSMSPNMQELDASRNDCAICLEPVYERTLEKRTSEDVNTINAFPCGHHRNMDNACFHDLIISNRNEVTIKCPVCRHKILVNSALRSRIRNARVKDFIQESQDWERESGVSVSEIVQRWPGILDIGRLSIQCTDSESIDLINCAYHVILNLDAEDHVTPLMEKYSQNVEAYIDSEMLAALPTLYEFRNARVFDYDGEIITLHQAFHYSLHAIGGDHIDDNLENIYTYIQQFSDDVVDGIIYSFSGVANYKYEMLFVEGMNMGFTIELSAYLLENPFVDATLLREKLEDISRDQSIAEQQVDGYIAQNYPNLVDIKNIGRFKEGYEHETIRYYVLMDLNPALEAPIAQNTWKTMNLEVAASAIYFDNVVSIRYGHCRQLLSGFMQNVPGDEITFYTALKYSSSPRLLRAEKRKWVSAIETQLAALGCEPFRLEDIPSESPKDALRFIKPRPQNHHDSSNLHLSDTPTTQNTNAFNTPIAQGAHEINSMANSKLRLMFREISAKQTNTPKKTSSFANTLHALWTAFLAWLKKLWQIIVKKFPVY